MKTRFIALAAIGALGLGAVQFQPTSSVTPVTHPLSWFTWDIYPTTHDTLAQPTQGGPGAVPKSAEMAMNGALYVSLNHPLAQLTVSPMTGVTVVSSSLINSTATYSFKYSGTYKITGSWRGLYVTQTVTVP
jgi:hypothetical protein